MNGRHRDETDDDIAGETAEETGTRE